MSIASGRHWSSYLAIFLLWLAIFVPGMFHPPLFDDADSAQAAEILRIRNLAGDDAVAFSIFPGWQDRWAARCRGDGVARSDGIDNTAEVMHTNY